MPLRQTITQFVSEISSRLGLPLHLLTPQSRNAVTALPERSPNPSPTNPPALEAGYRWVEVGEILEADDEYCDNNGHWTHTSNVGREVQENWRGRIRYRRRVAPDPGQGYRLLNSDEIVEQSDGFWHGQWGVVFVFGSPAGNGWYRRRVTPDPARIVLASAGFRLLRPGEALAADDEYYLDTERRWVQTQLLLSTADDSIIYRRAVQSVGAGFTRLFWGTDLQEGDEVYDGNGWVSVLIWEALHNPYVGPCRVDDDRLYRRPVQVDTDSGSIRRTFDQRPRYRPGQVRSISDMYLSNIAHYHYQPFSEDDFPMELDNGPNNWPAIRSPLIPLCWDTRQGVIFGPQSQLLYQILLSSLDIRRSNPGRGVYYLRNPKQLSTQSMSELEQWLRVNAYCYMGDDIRRAPWAARWERFSGETFRLSTLDPRQYHNFAYEGRSDTLLVFAHPGMSVPDGPVYSLVRSDLLCKIVAIGDAYFHHSFIMEMPRSDFNPSECNFLLNSLLARGSAMRTSLRRQNDWATGRWISDSDDIAINARNQNSAPQPQSSPPSSSSGAGGLIRKVKR